MSEYMQDELLLKFFDFSEESSGSQKTLDPVELMKLEEKVVSVRYLQYLGEMKYRNDISENDLAALADNFENSGTMQERAGLELYHLISIKKLMNNKEIPSLALPNVLSKIVGDTLSASAGTRKLEEDTVPALIVRLVGDGIRIIKSTLQGVSIQPEFYESTRNGVSTLEYQNNSRADLYQSTKDGMILEYQIIKESLNEVMLNINFISKIPGSCRVNLEQDGRIVSSQMLYENEDRVSVNKLNVGDYTVKIQGPSTQYSFHFRVEND